MKLPASQTMAQAMMGAFFGKGDPFRREITGVLPKLRFQRASAEITAEVIEDARLKRIRKDEKRYRDSQRSDEGYYVWWRLEANAAANRLNVYVKGGNYE